MYKLYIKRCIDVVISLIITILISPILLILIILGAIAMQGNPFFVQKRIGYKGEVFHLIKFRSMSNARDNLGNLLPNEKRLNKYGRILRSTSLDELPELFNIIIGTMSIIGPRPLLPEYLPYYTEEEFHRHDVRPGLTGLAQINGRNAIASWEERFQYDLKYIREMSFLLDVKIFIKTIMKVLKRSDIAEPTNITVGRLDEERQKTGQEREAL